MKKNKIWSLLCVLVIAFMLAGCSNMNYKPDIDMESDIVELLPNQKLLNFTFDEHGVQVLTRDMRVDEQAEVYHYILYVYKNLNLEGYRSGSITILETKE